MGWIISIILFMGWVISHDTLHLIASALFAIAGSIQFVSTSIDNLTVEQIDE